MAKADMFLKVDGTKQGPIKGESTDDKHPDEIEVCGWRWGMDGNATAEAIELETPIRVNRIALAPDSGGRHGGEQPAEDDAGDSDPVVHQGRQ